MSAALTESQLMGRQRLGHVALSPGRGRVCVQAGPRLSRVGDPFLSPCRGRADAASPAKLTRDGGSADNARQFCVEQR